MKDLTGEKYGRLTVLGLDHRVKSIWQGQNKGYFYYWKCQCECGNKIIVSNSHLRTGHTKSCGCYKNDLLVDRVKTHGLSNTRLFGLFGKIKGRCYNPNNPKYKNYGARGITICDEWLNNFKSFYDWAMDNGYDENAKFMECTIDRIDNNKGYSPENCRFVSNDVQARNKTTNHLITYNGETHCLAEWSEITGISKGAIGYRLKKGWDIELMLTKPMRNKHNDK